MIHRLVPLPGITQVTECTTIHLHIQESKVRTQVQTIRDSDYQPFRLLNIIYPTGSSGFLVKLFPLYRDATNTRSGSRSSVLFLNPPFRSSAMYGGIGASSSEDSRVRSIPTIAIYCHRLNQAEPCLNLTLHPDMCRIRRILCLKRLKTSLDRPINRGTT